MIVLLLFFKYFVMRKFKRFSLDNFPYFSCNIFSQIYLLSVTFMFSIFITRIISPAFYVEKKTSACELLWGKNRHFELLGLMWCVHVIEFIHSVCIQRDCNLFQ